GIDDAPVPGGWVMAPASTRSLLSHRCGAFSVVAAMAIAMSLLVDVSPAVAQRRALVSFPQRPRPPAQPGSGLLDPSLLRNTKEQMLVRANEVDYDYTNERVSAVGNVQIYYGGPTLQPDKG